ncbi:MAG: amidase domain-containing protein [Bacillota bacterium]|nr:amidase domain-containing protein [Bacillota bacterium]
MEKYTLNPNKALYPYYEKDDCANFVSQVLHAGGLKELGTKWDSFSSWFCHTNIETDLKKVSITWRAARFFRKHWGNENGAGFNRADKYYEMTISEALQNYSGLFNILNTGDVIQYGKPQNRNLPYHTQVIYKKSYNQSLGKNDVLIAQHTKNLIGASLYEYLAKQPDKEIKKIYIYILP